MSQLGRFGLVLTLVLGMVTAVASTASAEIGVLSTLPLSFTGKSGAGRLVSVKGKEISCTAIVGTGELTTKTEGSGSVTLTGCATEAGKVKCQTGETKGEISIKSTFTIVDLEAGSPAKLLAGVLSNSTTSTVITCGILKIEARGGAIAEATEYKEKVSEAFKPLPMPAAGIAELVLGRVVSGILAQSGGVQAIKTCHLEKAPCEGKTYHLEINFGAGFEEAALEGTAVIEVPESHGAIHVDY